MPDEPPYADRHVRWCERTAGQWLASYSIFARASCGPEPLLGHAGSTKFDRPQKRKRFWGARTSPTRRRCAKRLGAGVAFQTIIVLGSLARRSQSLEIKILTVQTSANNDKLLKANFQMSLQTF